MAILNSYVKLPEGSVSSPWFTLLPPLVNIQKAIEHGPFIVSFPIKNGDFP